MARTSYGVTTHSVTATGSNDNSKQVSVNAWNANHNKSEAGMLGFTKQSATISGNAIAATGTLIEIQDDGTLNTITPTDVNEYDLIYLIAKSTATSVTITHDAGGGAGKIRLLSAANETLSTTSPLILMCRTIGSNKEFVQYGGGVVNSLNDIGDVNITSIADNDLLAYDNSTSKWINQSPSEAGIVTADSTTTFTNKSIDLTDNTLTGTSAELRTAISDETGTGALVFATSPTLVTPALGTPASGTLTNCTFPTLNQSTTGNAATATSATSATTSTNVTVADESTATSCNVLFTTAATGDLPPKSGTNLTFNSNTGILTATGFAGALTGNVTGNADTVTTNANLTGDVTSTGNATTLGTVAVAKGGTNTTSYAVGDILYASGATTLSKLAKGTAGKILTMNSGATAPEWASAASAADTPWTVVHNFADFYYDMEVQTKPSNPSADHARFYVKQIDTNNDGLFCIMRKNGSDTQEVQIA